MVEMMRVNKAVRAFGFNFKKGFFIGRDDEGNPVFIYRQTAAGEWVGEWEDLEDFPGIPELVEEEEEEEEELL